MNHEKPQDTPKAKATLTLDVPPAQSLDELYDSLDSLKKGIEHSLGQLTALDVGARVVTFKACVMIELGRDESETEEDEITCPATV